jgi:hypothetical protein
LEIAVPVEDEGEAGAADAQILDQGVEGLEIDGCLDHENLVANLPLGGDDEVGRPA